MPSASEDGRRSTIQPLSEEKHSPSILLTGFEPFDRHKVNPSSRVARLLDGEVIAGLRVRGIELPVSVASAPGQLDEAIGSADWAVVLGLGLGPKRTAPSVERIAVNVLDFSLVDNEGAQPIDQPIVPGGSDGLFATIPIRRIKSAWQESGLPGYISNSAGTYLCNQIFYLIMQAARGRHFLGGFIHVPFLAEQAACEGNPPASMRIEEMALAVEIALAEAVRTWREKAKLQRELQGANAPIRQESVPGKP